MRGRAGARAISSLFQYIPPPLIKFFRTKPKQAGKKEGGLGEGIFARLLETPSDFFGRRRDLKLGGGWG